MRVLFLPNGSISTPSVRTRVYQFLPPLRELGIDAWALDPSSAQPWIGGHSLYRLRMLQEARRADVVVIQKRLFDLPTLLALRAANSRLVYDFDDAVYTRPDDPLGQPCKPAAGRLHSTLRIVRSVVAGNDELAAYASRYARSVNVIPTVVDTDSYLPRASTGGNAHPLTIGWVGTADNLPFLEVLRPVLGALRQRDLSLRFRVICSQAPSWPDVPFEFEPWTLERAIEAVKEFDVGVMPLPDTPWNRSKCGFKVLEYMALGVPAVASPVGVLQKIVRDGENGLLASSMAEWIERLERLVRDPRLRQSLALAGRRTVEERFSLAVAVPALLSVLEGVSSR